MSSRLNWYGTGPGEVGVKTGGAQNVSFNYSLSGPEVCNRQTWELYTTAKATKEMTINWDYTGSHAWLKPYRKISVVVNKPDGTIEKATLMEGTLRGTVTADGEESFQVYKGCDFSFIIEGKNSDSGACLYGTLTIADVTSVAGWNSSGNGELTIKPGQERQSIDFGYSLGGPAVHSLQAWKYYTTATETKEIMYCWNYDGSHAWFKPLRKISVIVNKPDGTTETETLYEGTQRGMVHVEGQDSFQIYEGQEYAFVMEGMNDDRDMRLFGTLNILEIPNLDAWKSSGREDGTIEYGANKRSIDFGYSLSGDAVLSLQTWKYCTTATETETINFDWAYKRFHTLFKPYLKISAVVSKPDGTSESTTLIEGAYRGNISSKASESIDVYEGKEYEFVIEVKNFEKDTQMLGTLNILEH